MLAHAGDGVYRKPLKDQCHRTGEDQDGKDGLHRILSRLLRANFILEACKPDPETRALRDYHLKLRRRRGNKVARVAVARKISTHVFYVLEEGKAFEEVISG